MQLFIPDNICRALVVPISITLGYRLFLAAYRHEGNKTGISCTSAGLAIGDAPEVSS
jgi:hypothetical protein